MAVLWILKLMSDGVRRLLTKMGSFNPLSMMAKEITESVRKVVRNMTTQVIKKMTKLFAHGVLNIYNS